MKDMAYWRDPLLFATSYLKVDDCMLGPDGAMLVAKLGMYVNSLDLTGCWKIGVEGCRALADMFAQSNSLSRVRICRVSRRNPEMMDILLRGLVKCKNLTHLDIMDQNHITCLDTIKLVCLLIHRLAYLCMGYGECGKQEGLEMIARAIATTKTLRTIEFFDMNMSGDPLTVLPPAFHHNLSLRSIHIGRNEHAFDAITTRNLMHARRVRDSVVCVILCLLKSKVSKDIARMIAKMVWFTRFDAEVWRLR